MSASMKCMVCGRGLADGVALFRQNKKGEPGIWACKSCTREPIDIGVGQIVSVIQKGNK